LQPALYIPALKKGGFTAKADNPEFLFTKQWILVYNDRRFSMK